MKREEHQQMSVLSFFMLTVGLLLAARMAGESMAVRVHLKLSAILIERLVGPQAAVAPLDLEDDIDWSR